MMTRREFAIAIGVPLAVALTLWVWALAAVVFAIRWNSIERPLPPARELFPYGELRVGVDASYPPFAVATADDLWGLDIDLGRELASRLNIPVRFVNLGFDGLYDALRTDQVDVLISALLVDPTRFGAVRYSPPYFNAGLLLVTTNDDIRTMSDLSGRALAYEFGSEADSEARRWLRRIQPFQTQPYELPAYALDAVRLGQADAALVDAVSAGLYRREHPNWNAQTHIVTVAPYAIASRANRPDVADAISRVLENMLTDGTIDALLDKYL
jgi:ABC-type amino acid transport substrate-binding protein